MASIEITVLYDNTPHPSDHELGSGWGFSAYIKTTHHHILFDTGWHGSTLKRNAAHLGVDLSKVDILVISHAHWDHAGGLPEILDKLTNPKIYLPVGYSEHQSKEIKRFLPRSRIIFQRDAKIIETAAPRLFLTGSLKTDIGIKEQGLIIEIDRNNSILLVGCCHPGLPSYFEAAERYDPGIYAPISPIKYIIGGLHGFKDIAFLEKKGVKKVYVGHCTQYKEDFLNAGGFDSEIFFTGFKKTFNLDLSGLFKEEDEK